MQMVTVKLVKSNKGSAFHPLHAVTYAQPGGFLRPRAGRDQRLSAMKENPKHHAIILTTGEVCTTKP